MTTLRLPTILATDHPAIAHSDGGRGSGTGWWRGERPR